MIALLDEKYIADSKRLASKANIGRNGTDEINASVHLPSDCNLSDLWWPNYFASFCDNSNNSTKDKMVVTGAGIMKPDRFSGSRYQHSQFRGKPDLWLFWVITSSSLFLWEEINDANMSALG